MDSVDLDFHYKRGKSQLETEDESDLSGRIGSGTSFSCNSSDLSENKADIIECQSCKLRVQPDASNIKLQLPATQNSWYNIHGPQLQLLQGATKQPQLSDRLRLARIQRDRVQTELQLQRVPGFWNPAAAYTYSMWNPCTRQGTVCPDTK